MRRAARRRCARSQPAGDLYVANATNVSAGSVTVYANGASKPLRRITNGINGPLNLLLCN